MELPEIFIQSIQDAPGFHESAFINAHAQPDVSVSIRINPSKFKEIHFKTLPIAGRIPWNVNGYHLTERPSFTLDPLFHAGAYYVQEASSMFLAEIMQQLCPGEAPIHVLDLCAAPGGKSTLLQSVMNPESLLVSNEVIKTRVNILEENICKWGAANVVVTNNDPKDFQRLPAFFDVVVVDAPCSGSGMFRKDPEAIQEWSLAHVELCAQRQKRILADVMSCIKENGLLIYSTCSYSLEEDEAITDWLVAEHDMESVRINVKSEWNVVESISKSAEAFGYRFYPDRVRGEGFFITVCRKRKEVWGAQDTMKNPFIPLSSKATTALTAYSLSPEHVYADNRNQDLYYFTPKMMEHLPMLMKALYVKKAGIKLGQLMHDDLIPDHALAMSGLLNDHSSMIELDLPAALDYLRSMPIHIGDADRGWRLVGYHGVILGWIKALPGRVNNYYPKSWRILNK